MDLNSEEFLKELLNDFKVEGSEHHQQIINGIIRLENEDQDNPDKVLVETIFRELHSLKGAARAVNLGAIEQLCMNLENLFHLIKDKKLGLNAIHYDSLYKAIDLLETLLQLLDKKLSPQLQRNLDQSISDISKIIHKETPTKSKLSFFEDETPETTVSAPPTKTIVNNDQDNSSDADEKENLTIETTSVKQESIDDKELTEQDQTVRVALSKLYGIMHDAEEMIALKSFLDHRVDQMYQLTSEFRKNRIKLADLLANEVNQHGPQDRNNSLLKFFSDHEEKLNRESFLLNQLKQMASKAVDELLMNTRKTLMQQFSVLLHIVPRIVRDLSKTDNKEIEVITNGSDTEIDRRILEELKDPLIHIIRNSIDHGIEAKDIRLKKGKPSKAKITISIALKSGSKIEIRISDDGSGINLTKLKESAIKKGIITAEESKQMTDKAIANLIFSSGVSTNTIITDVSGRGLGMAIVESKVGNLGGTIDLETEKDIGTTFIINIPQSLSSFKGILVKSAGKSFIIPTVSVLGALRINKKSIKTIESKNTINYDSQTIGLVRFGDVIGINSSALQQKEEVFYKALVLQSSNNRMAFIVDEILGEHEGIVKNLGAQLKHINNIAGATMLGDSNIVPVIEVGELIKNAIKNQKASSFETTNANEADDNQKKRILIVEDSITVRNMLRSMVEAAGFEVKTAVDGLEGFNFAKNESFDLVVTDIEMPHMSGFELTKEIRADKELADVPVILVTTLDSEQDKRKGMDAGANAYIVKSNFEKSNLVGTINSLI